MASLLLKLQRDLIAITELSDLGGVEEKWRDVSSKIKRQAAREATSFSTIAAVLKEREEELEFVDNEECNSYIKRPIQFECIASNS